MMSLNDPDYDFYTIVQSLSQIWQRWWSRWYENSHNKITTMKLGALKNYKILNFSHFKWGLRRKELRKKWKVQFRTSNGWKWTVIVDHGGFEPLKGL